MWYINTVEKISYDVMDMFNLNPFEAQAHIAAHVHFAYVQ